MREKCATDPSELSTITPPPHAIEVGEWVDLDRHPTERTWRPFTGQRRGVQRYSVQGTPSGPHFVEASACQEADGRLTEVCVRAEINAWDLSFFDCWDSQRTPEQARSRAKVLRRNSQIYTLLADAFDAAAADAERWSTR